MSVFVHRDDQTPLKVVFVSDDSSQEQLNAFEESSSRILGELQEKGVNQIIKESEEQMFVKISKHFKVVDINHVDMKEVLNAIICNTT